MRLSKNLRDPFQAGLKAAAATTLGCIEELRRIGMLNRLTQKRFGP